MFSKECQGSIRMEWRTFFYNMYVVEMSHNEVVMEISEDEVVSGNEVV